MHQLRVCWYNIPYRRSSKEVMNCPTTPILFMPLNNFINENITSFYLLLFVLFEVINPLSQFDSWEDSCNREILTCVNHFSPSNTLDNVRFFTFFICWKDTMKLCLNYHLHNLCNVLIHSLNKLDGWQFLSGPCHGLHTNGNFS